MTFFFKKRRFRIPFTFLAFLLSSVNIIYTRPDLRVSLAGNSINNGMKLYNNLCYMIKGHSMFGESLTYQHEPYKEGSWKVPSGYKNTKISLSYCNAYFLEKEDNEGTSKVIYQLHGGGYVSTFSDNYNEMALRYSSLYDDAPVFSIDYRTAPKYMYPCALNDAIEGYQYLLSSGYKGKDIVIVGDSAGGGLSLSLSLYLRDNKIDLPKCLALSSPATDLTESGKSRKEKILVDPLFGAPSIEEGLKNPLKLPYAKDDELENPYVSPAFGDYEGMPPMIIQTGENEILLSDSDIVYEKASLAKVNIKYITYPGMYHTFYLVSPNIRESKQAYQEIKEFIKSV